MIRPRLLQRLSDKRQNPAVGGTPSCAARKSRRFACSSPQTQMSRRNGHGWIACESHRRSRRQRRRGRVRVMKDKSLGTLCNSVADVAGGAGMSALLPVLLPAIGTIAQHGSLEIGAIPSQILGDTIAMIAVALIRNAIPMKSQPFPSFHHPGDQTITGAV